MTKLSLGEKIRLIRKGLKLNQTEFAKLLGYKFPTTVSKFEDNKQEPDKDKLIKIAELGNISLDELLTDASSPQRQLTGQGHVAKEESPFKVREEVNHFSEPPRHPAAALMPSPGAGPPGVDPAIQAMSDIKEIFDSGDPILVPAIQANLSAFKRALLRERQFAQVIQENMEIKERLEKLEKLCGDWKSQLEKLTPENQVLRAEVNRLKATYEAPDGGDGHLTNSEEKAM